MQRRLLGMARPEQARKKVGSGLVKRHNGYSVNYLTMQQVMW